MTTLSSLNHFTQKRLQGDLLNLKKESSDEIDAVPNDTNMLEWFFLVRGAKETPFHGGYYLGKLNFPADYPNKGPALTMLTPSGRFLINQNVCLTNTHYHPESWNPLWNIYVFLIGFISIMSDDKTNGVAHIIPSYGTTKTAEQLKVERVESAKASAEYNKTHLKEIWCKFDKFVNSDGTVKSDDEIKASIIASKEQYKLDKKKSKKDKHDKLKDKLKEIEESEKETKDTDAENDKGEKVTIPAKKVKKTKRSDT
jgi:ubiquitin-protein ligase